MSISSQSNNGGFLLEATANEKARPQLRTRIRQPDIAAEVKPTGKKESRLKLKKRFRKRRSDSSAGSDGSAHMNGRTGKFHRLFDIATTEVLIRTFPCALKAEILLQGTFYVSANFFCFYARLANKRKTIKIPIRTVCEITREKTAIFFPNAIGIRTEDSRYVFGSILSRENTLKLLLELWNAAICPAQDCHVPVVAGIQESRRIFRSSSDSDLASLQVGGSVLVKHRGHLHLNGECLHPPTAAQSVSPVTQEHQQSELTVPQLPPPPQQHQQFSEAKVTGSARLFAKLSHFFLQIFLIIKSHLAFIVSDHRMAVGCSIIVLCLAYVLYLAYQIHLIQQSISERLEELLKSSSILSPLSAVNR
ncbi:hypothetical protein BOX15_Mlig009334g1 [Macrostomum lignano]|uniref:GRAM domain-containing protein n=1 Tax=Macrostomum lignano TaxID=282301 RepID=A0A267GQY9_9PLAT|nr:hypothetical protein BOX15_Mlig009334g1 [Macrostomum lignano]